LTSEGFLLWLGKRNIYLKSIQLNNTLFAINSPTVLGSLYRIAHFLEELTVDYCSLENSKCVKRFLRELWAVRRLTLSKSRFVDRFFLEDLSFPFLEYLNLNETSMELGLEQISNETTDGLVNYQLSCVNFRGDDIKDIIDNNHFLQTLNISRNFDMDDLSYEKLSTCINLTSLNLSGQPDFAHNLDGVIQTCFKLTDLDISYCFYVGNRLVRLLTESKLKLKKLNISGAQCDHDVFVALFAEKTTIEHIGMNHLQKATLETFSSMVDNLTLLTNVSFKRADIDSIMLYNLLCSCFSKIHIFDLIGSVLVGIPAVRPCVGNKGGRIDDRIMEHNEIKELKITLIDNCYSPNGFHKIFLYRLKYSFLTSLTIANLSEPVELFRLLSGQVKTLTYLSLRSCWTLNNKLLEELLVENKGLKIFECLNCRDLTDNIMYTLMSNNKGLRSFTMRLCNTTYTGLIELVRRCRFLTYVDFDCKHESSQHVFDIQEVIAVGYVLSYVNLHVQKEVIDLTIE
jgi:hypothetical protein